MYVPAGDSFTDMIAGAVDSAVDHVHSATGIERKRADGGYRWQDPTPPSASPSPAPAPAPAGGGGLPKWALPVGAAVAVGAIVFLTRRKR